MKGYQLVTRFGCVAITAIWVTILVSNLSGRTPIQQTPTPTPNPSPSPPHTPGGGPDCMSPPVDFDPVPNTSVSLSATAPSGGVPGGRFPGQNGIPVVDFDAIGLNHLGTSGPIVSGSVNGTGGGSSVFLGTGAAFVSHRDFSLPLNGIDWLHERKYSSTHVPSQTWVGQGWWTNEMMNLTRVDGELESTITIQMDPHYSLIFTYNTFLGTWDISDRYLYTLVENAGSDEYKLTRADGFLYVFHDEAVANNPGRIKRIEDAYGNDQAFTYSSGQLTDIVVDVVDGSDYKITYTYFTSGDSNGLLQYVKVYKSTTTTDANLIGKIEHVYHDSSPNDYGLEDDLMKVTISSKATNDGDGTLSITSDYYYRYYKGTYNATTNPGTDHQLRYVLFPENASRMGSPESQTNATWESYTNVFYKYHSGTRVKETQERLPGTSCGCSGSGALTTNYTWTANTGTPNVDTWMLHCVADRADDSRVIFDVNRLYEILTWVVQDQDDGTPNISNIWHFDYGTSGDTEHRLTAAYSPTAVSSYNEGTYAVTLNSSAGLVHTVEYDTGTYKGYPKKIRVKEGSSGSATTLIQILRITTARPDLPYRVYHYESAGEADGRITAFGYTFYDAAKFQFKQVDIAFPMVSTGKNGPGGEGAQTSQFFDKRTGALRWTLDAEGYVNFYAYDDATGMSDLAVVDANTSTLLTVLDDNWDGVAHGGLGADDTVPFSRTGTGTALDIDSSSTIDWLGRTRKTTDAGGLVTYYVYKNDEMRVYPAWYDNSGTYRTMLPFSITLTDKEGRPEEQMTIKVCNTADCLDPSVNGSYEPTGTESYTNAKLASWSITTYNLSGMVLESDRYHNIPSSGTGTRYTNFYRTTREYDSMGRLQYSIEDVANESDYDREQVTKLSYDFLGRQTKVEEGVSDNTHNISSGKPTLKVTSESFYDDPDTDATPESGSGNGRLSWTRKWFGAGGSDYNDTAYRYDFRDRRCLTIPPASPYTLVKYDNLDRVTTTGSYGSTTNLDPGDDPATTENTNRLDLNKTYFDEMGRVYKTETYDDPSDATPADVLASNTYFDRRSLVWASAPANSGISFTRYDGAGRRTQSFQGTQFDTAKYTSSLPDYPDDNEGIIHLVDYTLDDDGQVQKVITKELKHDDAAGMDLTNNNDYIRTYTYHWRDAAHRLTATCNYGTNNASGWKDNSTAPTYGANPPTRSDTELVTSYSYNNWVTSDAYFDQGRFDTVTDPKGIVTKTVSDWLGRTLVKIEDQGMSLLNRKTEYQYNAQGSLVRIIADLSGDNTLSSGTWTMVGGDTDQVTEYAYTDSQSARRVKEIRYPTGDGTVGSSQSDKIVFTYNQDGTLATRTDQNGTVLTWAYDTLRRKTEEEVTTLGTYTGGAAAVDSAIRAFTWTYDSEGRVQYLTAHTDTTPDTSTWTDAANQVKYTYNAADKLTKEEQEYDGAVDGSTLAVEYGYGTDYASSYFNRLDYVEYPDNRKIWNGYTHSGGAGTHQDTINSVFNRVGQIAKDSSGSIGSLLAEYDFNGTGRFVRRVHDEDSGKYGNDTRTDLWHGTSGQYDGLDRFGRIVDMKFTDFNGTAYDFERRKYGHDRDGNRTSIEHTLYKAENQSFTYDSLNRLTEAKSGLLNSSKQVQASNVYETYAMDRLGNFTPEEGGIKINTTTSTITQAVNATNEITTLDQPNASGDASIINDPFTSSLADYWTQVNGSAWSISSSKVNVDALDSDTTPKAILLASPTVNIFNMQADVTFPTGSSMNNKAGLLFGYQSSTDFYAVVLDRAAGELALYKVTGGSWGSALATSTLTINATTPYTIRVIGKQKTIEAYVGTTSIECTLSAFRASGQLALYSSKAGVTFDNVLAYDSTSRHPKGPAVSGLANATVTGGKLVVNAKSAFGGEAIVENFADNAYVFQVDVDFNGGKYAEVWGHFTDVNNGLQLLLDNNLKEYWLYSLQNGEKATTLSSGSFSPATPLPVKFKFSKNNPVVKVWINGSLKYSGSGTPVFGGVAFGGTQPTFDNLKIGYDNNSDDDIDDVGDDLVISESFDSSSRSISYDHAGNLIDDGRHVFVYDAWNRLVKSRASLDADVTVQTAEFFADGRRAAKTVSNSGEYDATEVYLYNGQKIIETRDGSNNVTRQFVHGTQYIDELVMMRVKNKGDLYVHQDANWNVIALTDLARNVVERYVYTPYGEVVVHQEDGFGDRDGDDDVDSTDKGTVGTTCTGTVTGSCRILDLDFDGDYDSTDAGFFDSLPQGFAKYPGRFASGVSQPFMHQGLYYEPETGQYQNRKRQYMPSVARFQGMDPLGPSLFSSYAGYGCNPISNVDPSGAILCQSQPPYGSQSRICIDYIGGDRASGTPILYPASDFFLGRYGFTGCCVNEIGACVSYTCIDPTIEYGSCLWMCTVVHEGVRAQNINCGFSSGDYVQCAPPCRPSIDIPDWQFDCNTYTATCACHQNCEGVPPGYEGPLTPEGACACCLKEKTCNMQITARNALRYCPACNN